MMLSQLLLILAVLGETLAAERLGILRTNVKNEATFIMRCKDKISGKPAFLTQAVRNLAECVRLCLQPPECKAFNFKLSTKDKCELLNITIKETAKCTEKTGWNYYDASPQNVSAIRDKTGQFCFAPETLNSTIISETFLVMKQDSSICNEIYAKFIFNVVEGTLTHMVSGLGVCPLVVDYNRQIYITSRCPDRTGNHHWRRTHKHSLSYANHWCIQALGGVNTDGKRLTLHYQNCNKGHNKYSLFETEPGVVKVSTWASFYGSRADLEALVILDSPTHVEYADHMYSTAAIGSYYGLVLTAFFVPRVSGVHYFYVAGDDYHEIRFGLTRETSGIIASESRSAGLYGFGKYATQKSGPQDLIKGQKYFMQAMLIEKTGNDHLQVGMLQPNQSTIVPVTSEYLLPYE